MSQLSDEKDGGPTYFCNEKQQMEQPTITTKIGFFVGIGIKNRLSSFIDAVSEGDIAGFEEQLSLE